MLKIVVITKKSSNYKNQNKWKTEVKEKTSNTIDHSNLKINGAFDDKYIEYTSSGSENTSIKQYLEKSLINIIKEIKNWVNGKFN